MMEDREIFFLGLGLRAPWKVMSQHLDAEKQPQEFHLELAADRGSLCPCPQCGQAEHVLEVVCDMSPAFLAAVGEEFEHANVTVDWLPYRAAVHDRR